MSNVLGLTTQVSYLRDLLLSHTASYIGLVGEDEETCPHEPLFANQYSLFNRAAKMSTSSCNKDASSCLQSVIRGRSVASTTQIKASVFSK